MTLAVPYIPPHNARIVRFYASGTLQFLWFLWWAEEVPHSGCKDNSLQNKSSSLSVSASFAVFRRQRIKKKTVSTSQSNDTVKILYSNMYANYFNPFNNLAGGHWSLHTPEHYSSQTGWLNLWMQR